MHPIDQMSRGGEAELSILFRISGAMYCTDPASERSPSKPTLNIPDIPKSTIFKLGFRSLSNNIFLILKFHRSHFVALRFDSWFHFTFDKVEKWIDFIKFDSLQRVGLQHLSNQGVPAWGELVFRQWFVLELDYSLDNFFLGVSIERQLPRQHGVENASHWSNV